MKSSLPKVLQTLGGRPMLLHLLETAAALGPEQVHVVIGSGATAVTLVPAMASDAAHTLPSTSVVPPPVPFRAPGDAPAAPSDHMLKPMSRGRDCRWLPRVHPRLSGNHPASDPERSRAQVRLCQSVAFNISMRWAHAAEVRNCPQHQCSRPAIGASVAKSIRQTPCPCKGGL